MNFFSKLLTEKYKLEKEREEIIFKINKIKEKKGKPTKKSRGVRFERRNYLKNQVMTDRVLNEMNDDIRKLDIKLAMYLLQPYLKPDEISVIQEFL